MQVSNTLNDYNLIRVKDSATNESNLLYVEQSVEWYQDEVKWLREQVSSREKRARRGGKRRRRREEGGDMRMGVEGGELTMH